MRRRIGPGFVHIQDAVVVQVAQHIGRSRGGHRIRHHQVVDLDVAGILHRDGIGDHVAYLVVGQRVCDLFHNDQRILFDFIGSRGRQRIHRRLARRQGGSHGGKVCLHHAQSRSLCRECRCNGLGFARGHGANIRPVDGSIVDVVGGGRHRRNICQIGGFIGVHNRHIDQHHIARVDHRDMEHHRIAHLGGAGRTGARLL